MKKQNYLIAVFILWMATFILGGCGGQPSSTSPPSFSQFMVCLDPGHPSETSAGTAANGLKEVGVNWQVSNLLYDMLKAQGVPVIMTKSTLEQTVTNQERARIANEANATLFVRLHCNSGGGKGITFFYPDKPGTKDGITGPSDEIIRKSKTAAALIHAKTVEHLSGSSLKDNGVRGESLTQIGSQQGALTGSIYSEVPVLTVEMIFLDYAPDARFIESDDGQHQMAEALKAGIIAYLSSF